MNHRIDTELPLLATATGTCCGGGGCGCSTSQPTHDTPGTTTTEKETPMTDQTKQTFQVTGMTCGHCASAVIDEVKQLPGVSGVDVELVAGGISTVQVTGTETLDEALVATALDEAGDYQLA